MIDLVGITRWTQQEAPHLPRMNASNHLRRAVSSLARERQALIPSITMKDRLQCLFKVLVGCSGQVQRRWNAELTGALISLFAPCSLSIDYKPINS